MQQGKKTAQKELPGHLSALPFKVAEMDGASTRQAFA
jgi:hypothetical protein